MCVKDIFDNAFKLDPLDLLGRRKDRKASNQTTMANAALTQQQDIIAEEAKKKRVARKPVQTIIGGAQTPTEGVTLGS
jgi:hypothetical protein